MNKKWKTSEKEAKENLIKFIKHKLILTIFYMGIRKKEIKINFLIMKKIPNKF